MSSVNLYYFYKNFYFIHHPTAPITTKQDKNKNRPFCRRLMLNMVYFSNTLAGAPYATNPAQP